MLEGEFLEQLIKILKKTGKDIDRIERILDNLQKPQINIYVLYQPPNTGGGGGNTTWTSSRAI